ncbi:MAG TPA: nucleotide exchange factor GrpE [Solirubrobacterales bacterium]|nr:nucleotide exchange factor GrpE [Solirubrobacterales bacterium]
MTSAPDAPEGRAETETEDVHPAPPAEGSQAPEGPEEQAVEHDLDRLLEEIRGERDSYLDLARRTKADFENYRKRAARDAADAERRGKASLARELLPAIDNLERALRSAGIEDASADPSAEASSEEASAQEALARGVALVLGELQATLERAGVEAYDPVGERFDPSWHEALHTRAVEGAAAGVVVETLERGYRLDGQVLRAARVVVSE